MALLTIETDGTVRDVLDEATLGANITSDTIDFTSCIVASIQATWTGNDKSDGILYLESSIKDDDDWFDEILGSTLTMDASGSGRGNKKTVLWSHENLGFRFVRVVYLKGTNTAGTFDVKAAGKNARW